MRGLAVIVAAMLAGCFVDPGPGGLTGAGTGDATTGAATTGGGSTGGQPTTEATGGTGTSEGGTSTGSPGTTTTTTDATTGGATGPATTTTGEPTGCMNTVEVALASAASDAGVVPPITQPCPLGGLLTTCERLNFGQTSHFRMFNDDQYGQSALLVRFSADEVLQGLFGAGYTIDDLVAVRVELLVWEPLKEPAAPVEFAVGLVHEGDADFLEGTKDAAQATDGDSSFLCKQIVGKCAPWLSDGGPQPSATPLGPLTARPEDQPALDLDANDSEYHMMVKSDPLPGEPVRARLLEKLDAAFVVTLASPRKFDDLELGIKTRESPWPHPALYATVCAD